MWTLTGESIVRQFDTKGNVTEESYYDAQGKPEVAKGDTYAIVRYERSDEGQKLVTRYLGTDEKPVVAKDGCATERENLDAKGKLLKDACFDVNGRPMMSKSNLGAAVLTWVRDSKERVTEMEGFGPDGKPVLTTSGYTRASLQYDAAGNMVRIQIWTLTGESIVRQFDTKGNVTEESYYDAQGKREIAK
jgi:hypothetical protein